MGAAFAFYTCINFTYVTFAIAGISQKTVSFFKQTVPEGHKYHQHIYNYAYLVSFLYSKSIIYIIITLKLIKLNNYVNVTKRSTFV